MSDGFIEKINKSGVKVKVFLDVNEFCNPLIMPLFKELSRSNLDELIELSFTIAWLENGINMDFDGSNYDDCYQDLLSDVLKQMAKFLELKISERIKRL
ncbi:hypothetical protein R7Z80_24835 [Vibrio sp. 1733]|uniref:hypothetical protein n=1 Tax=Vibrio TaxID=662 RepID=UPI001121104B|nr:MULTISPECIES: hypothetical protein [Vibrio]HCZ9037794.1 hypothetical protein [Vibrio alginolyticus]EJG1746511.1 hypothetical protein [Vibrio parahaemolyticus]MCC4215679.1 hypothetical protein [Vibrio parahaemolyticus]MDW2189071.1 hypothetical protein [Vibrio sp. 1733]MDW2238996.1 hypothetical protein [Vibrio sp. 1565-1]